MRSRVCVAAVILILAACTRPIAQRGSVSEVIGPSNQPMNLQLTMRDGRRVNFWGATIAGDSVIGFHDQIEHTAGTRRAAAKSEIRAVAIRKKSPPLVTALFIAASAGVAFVLFVGFAASRANL